MSKTYILVPLFVFFLFGCNDIDKSLVSDAVKLNSPYCNFSLYRYFVDSPMSFGSGFTALKILPFDEKCDYTDRDFFVFSDHSYPFYIKWKNKDTLYVKCLIESSEIDGGRLTNTKQPVRKDIQKWKDWTFEVEYYSLYSGGGANGGYSVTSYEINSEFIRFNSNRSLPRFKTNELTLELDSGKISLRTFKVDTFKSKTGLSFTDYELKMDKNYRINDFKSLQPFVVTKP